MTSLAHVLEEESTPLSVFDLPLRYGVPFANRRSLPRVAGRFVVRGADGITYKGIDLSFGGLLCIGDQPLWPGNTMAVAIEFNDNTVPLYVTGRVVELVSYRGRVGMRIRLEDVTPNDRKCIAAWMAREAAV